MPDSIATTALTRRFGAITAVDHLELAVPEGAVYAFLGPNGAGKTTTIRLLLGLARPDSGDIRILGTSLAAGNRSVLRQVGALVESPSLYPHLTGRENLEISRRLLALPRSASERALDIVELRDAAERRVAGYSLGMRQRLGLALALLATPRLLILDEPTNGLDPQGIQELRELIREMPKRCGCTVFLSSHLLGEVEQVATHIGVVNRGTLRFQGTLSQLESRRKPQVVVGVSSPGEALRHLASRGWSVSGDGDMIRVSLAGDRAAAARLVNDLVGAGYDVWHVAVEQRSLEDEFLAMTSNDKEAPRESSWEF